MTIEEAIWILWPKTSTGNIFGINGGNLLPMKRRKSMKLK